MAKAVTTAPSAAVAEQVFITGDLSKLTSQERVQYYKGVCDSVGLNPLTKPFEYITLNGKLTLYALRACTDQLRTIHNVSVESLEESERDGVFIVTAKVKNAEGRTDMSKGAVNIKGLTGENLANALMKTETKAKRRATLSLCGLGFLDETEVETIPGAKIGEPSPQPAPAQIAASVSQATAPAPAPEKTANAAAVHGIAGDGLDVVDAPVVEQEKPIDINFARTVFESVKKMVADAKDESDIDLAMKSNAEGLRMLKRASEVNYNKLRDIVTARRQDLKVDSFQEDFGGEPA